MIHRAVAHTQLAIALGALVAVATMTRRAGYNAAPEPVEQTIHIDNFTFDPPSITVPAGTKLTWVNRDDVPHTATAKAKPRAFDSGALDTDESYSFVFTKPGEFAYFCALHPHMTGKVIVK